MIDTHAHIYAAEFDVDRNEVVQRAKLVGVEHVILPNENVASLPLLYATERDYPSYCLVAIGLHPEEVKDDYKQQLSLLGKELERRSFVAIGEVGMDLYWDATYREQQKYAFQMQIEWALRYDIPLIIHTRNAWEDTLALLQRYKSESLKGVFHCFDAPIDVIPDVLSYAFYLGIGGIMTFKKSALPSIVKDVAIDRIVTETDAPYLAPVPHRGSRNEPSFMFHTLEKLAEIYSLPVSDVNSITTENAKKLFSL